MRGFRERRASTAPGTRCGATFALATSLSSICKQLDVDVVRGGDTGVQPFWGQTGHYDIASFACGQVKSKKLGKLLAANLDRISFAQSAAISS